MLKRWKILPVPDIGDDYDGHFRAIRLNSLGSLSWFTKNVLGKTRLKTFHEHLCRSLEADDLHLVLEVPMGMFKTTLSTALSIWWSLPFAIEDEHEMNKLGYKSAWIRYMKRVHNQNARTLVAHEIDKRAVDMGKEVDFTYWENDLFRQVFAAILPDRDCEWNDHSKHQKRSRDLPIDPTNPTFMYCGVGHALQGVRADSTIEDDIFGRAAQESMLKRDGSVVENVIRWHRQLSTRLDTVNEDTRRFRQLIPGNRWGHADLNSWIRKNQPQFIFETHDAEGGCCKLHPEHGVPIFPEEFSMDVLAQKKLDNTAYDYAHFYRNISVLPEEQIFKESWLRKFIYKKARPELPETDLRNILLLEHMVYDGVALDDFQPGALEITILVDPNHSKKVKRKAHIIWTIGLDPGSSRIYLLNLYQEETTYSEVVENIYREYARWTGTLQQPQVYMGKLAFKLLGFYLGQRDKVEERKYMHFEINEFDDEDSLGAMKNRIEAMEPIFKQRQVWCHPSQNEFIEAFTNYPAADLDSLEVLGYYPTIVDVSNTKEASAFMQRQVEAFTNRNSGSGGY